MKNTDLIGDNQKMIRTQISLTPTLKRKIERQAQALGESMADFLRKAALQRIEEEMKKRLALKKLADKLTTLGEGGMDGQWKTKREIDKWFAEVRDEWER